MNINICFSTDNNYAQHLAVAIVSILKNSKETDTFSFFVLDAGITYENKNKISELKKIKDFNIEYIKINLELFKDYPHNSKYITIATYSRLLISSLLNTMDKVIYLDCDLVVCCSLDELFVENIDNYHIAGVEDIYYYHYRRYLKREIESLYINTGVLLINLKKWRQDNIEEKLLAVPKNTTIELVHQDQDIINIVLNKTTKPLDLKWNVMNNFFRVVNHMEIHPLKRFIKIAWQSPAIVHFTNEIKPWHKSYIPYGNLYLKYLQYTSFEKEYLFLLNQKQTLNEYMCSMKTRLYYAVRHCVSPVIAFRRFGDCMGIRLFMVVFFKIGRYKIEKSERFAC